MKTFISTWFVQDDDESATFFPQISMLTSTPSAREIYWRCVATFFVSSVVVNVGRKHVFYTNATLPCVDGISFSDLFRELDVEVVNLPITYRLPKGIVSSWGNQFYILDIIKHIAKMESEARHFVFDSDCVWLRSVDEMEAALDRHGALTYNVYKDQSDEHRSINGVSERDLTGFYNNLAGRAMDRVVYCGGEQFSCRGADAVKLGESVDKFWEETVKGGFGSPREEAHFLSLLYAYHGYEIGTADRFIRRIWTSLRKNNACVDDLRLAIWHLPSEKRSGLQRLFRRLRQTPRGATQLTRADFNQETYSLLLGVPRRTWRKLAADIYALALRKAKQFGRR